MKYLIASVLIISLGLHNLSAQVDARMLQYPDVSSTHITFAYGGDVWVLPKQGGTAHKLTSAGGGEMFPRFSPDGSQIAFSGNYHGNVDVFTIPTLGGSPRRITHHGMNDLLIDWYPDGKSLLFTSSRESGKQRFSQFYKVSATGGLPEKLIIPYGEFGALSADGKQIAYTPRTTAFRTWKRYRGGMAADVWLFNLENGNAELIIKNDANDELPMWRGNTLYFLSDRDANKRLNLWSYDMASKQARQLTFFTDFDVHFPAIGPDEIVYEAGGRLYLFNLTTEKQTEVSVNVVTDEATLLPRQEKVESYLQSYTVSPDGKRGVIEARGEVFSVPAVDGPVLNLTQSSGVAERYPAWSPDGKSIAYWSDRSGEYELTLRDLKSNTERKLTSYGAGFRYQLYWSPNSKLLAFIDKAMEVFIFDVENNRTLKVDKQLLMFEGALQGFSVSFSADSRYMAYAKNLPSGYNAIAIYDVKEQKSRQVTSGFYNDIAPAFDPDGKYLYFLTNRSFSPLYSDFDNTWTYANATQIAAVPLTKETASPLAPKNDEVTPKETAKADDAKKDDKSKGKEKDKKDAADEKKDEVKPVNITFDGFEQRLVILPVKAGNMNNVQAISGKVVYHRGGNTGANQKERPIMIYDLESREESAVLPDADGYVISADGKKMMVHAGGSFSIVDVAANQSMSKNMPTGKMEMRVVPKEEWKQIFMDAWRFERDYFYDANMHGVNWNAMRERYGKLIDASITRSDVNYVIGELISEMNASHTYRSGGDIPAAPQKAVGYLGIDWGLKDGAYYVKRIVRGAPWDNEVRSALDQPGLKIKEGDFILAVNNVTIDVTKDPWAAFEGLNKGAIELTVNNTPGMTGAWKVLVEPLGDETRLRNLEWIEKNRKRVEEASQGKVGYVYVPSTGVGDGQYELVRMFYGQHDKPGMIVDERFNNGGQIPDRFIELLNRKPLAYWAVRDGQTWQWPPVGNFGPKAMLINEWSGSGGDAFPDYFRKAGLGPLIGMRTWGGLIGISGAPTLIDGGNVTVPTFRMFNPDGTWFKEGHGVDPDIEVIDDPSQLAKGIDPQLERAIQEVMKQLANKPVGLPQKPGPEVR
jgi:tricorn protease